MDESTSPDGSTLPISSELQRFLATNFNPAAQEWRWEIAETLGRSPDPEYAARLQAELAQMVEEERLDVHEWEALTQDDEFETEAELYTHLREILEQLPRNR